MVESSHNAVVKNIVRQHKLFTQCSEKFLDDLAAQSLVLKCQKGRVIFVHEEEAQRFFIIQSGMIKLYRETMEGAQAVIDILPAGAIFGEGAIFDKNQYPYSSEAIEASDVISLPLAVLKGEVDANPKMAQAMLQFMAGLRKRQDQEIEHLTLQSAPQRIGCFFLKMVRQSEQNSNDKVVIHLPYDKTLLASRLGMQPETFSRALAKLKDIADVQVKGGEISIGKMTELAAYSCAACSSEYPCKS